MEEHIKEKTEEIYAIDAQKDLNMVIAGGGDDAVTFYKFNGTEYIIDEVIEGFEDSVVMARFISGKKAVAVSMDGTLAEINIVFGNGRYMKEVHTADLQMDVSKAVLSEDKTKIYVGTVDGMVERVPLSANEVESRIPCMYIGHSSDILEIVEIGDVLYTLSSSQIIIYDKEKGSLLAKYQAEVDSDIRVMQVNSTGRSVGVGYGNGLVCILAYSSTQNTLTNVYKNDNPERTSVESISFIEDLLIFGDFKSTVTIIDTKYKIEKTCILSEDEACVVKIIAISSAVAIAITNTGKVFVISLKSDNKILSEYSIHSITLDAVLFNRYICAATVEGVEFLPLT
ncbi:hypothetical protein NEMIN01_0816 [Nematocida minor]|uniref:uncharacterized protein n=1 Tax=Nematocida minor TaxID=1912983 RepID=UPI00221E6102|nr:uncharacterized protein NEMIN01_0816 [Nematocida minor]KAI5190031.1 hypothetical protein NEMIN01_0816 [Nematocida minor]